LNNFDTKSGVGEGALTVRADHPLPPRDFDCSYFEVEVIKCPIGEDEKQSCVVIGLCGEFSDLWKAVPGWRKFSAGYHSDLGATYEDVAYEESDHTDLGQTYGEGDVVGCGVDWKSEAYYFTYNGKFLRKFIIILRCRGRHNLKFSRRHQREEYISEVVSSYWSR
jgi:hypothetical protein